MFPVCKYLAAGIGKRGPLFFPRYHFRHLILPATFPVSRLLNLPLWRKSFLTKTHLSLRGGMNRIAGPSARGVGQDGAGTGGQKSMLARASATTTGPGSTSRPGQYAARCGRSQHNSGIWPDWTVSRLRDNALRIRATKHFQHCAKSRSRPPPRDRARDLGATAGFARRFAPFDRRDYVELRRTRDVSWC